MKDLEELDNETAVSLLTKAFADSGLTYSDPAEALSAFKAGNHTIISTPEGLQTIYNGHRQPLHLALGQWGRTGEGEVHVDKRSLPHGEKSVGGVRSKSDLTTPALKTAYIAKHGLAAFEKLPRTYTPTSEVVYRDEYYKLPLSQKVELGKKGVTAADFPARVAPAGDGMTVKNGARVNEAGLAKQRAINPNKK